MTIEQGPGLVVEPMLAYLCSFQGVLFLGVVFSIAFAAPRPSACGSDGPDVR